MDSQEKLDTLDELTLQAWVLSTEQFDRLRDFEKTYSVTGLSYLSRLLKEKLIKIRELF